MRVSYSIPALWLSGRVGRCSEHSCKSEPAWRATRVTGPVAPFALPHMWTP